MTAKLPFPTSDRDQAALDAATATGLCFVSDSDSTSELTPERAVMLSLSRHIARVTGRVESTGSAPAEAIEFADVRWEWPRAWEGALYPTAVLVSVSEAKRDAFASKPKRGISTIYGKIDVTSPDEKWLLWSLGEDTGVIDVAIIAKAESAARALAKAVEDAVVGDLDKLQGCVLPLPEAFLPPPFQGVLDPTKFPICRLEPASSPNGTGDLSSFAEANAWRIDVHVKWQAQRILARPALGVLRPVISVSTANQQGAA